MPAHSTDTLGGREIRRDVKSSAIDRLNWINVGLMVVSAAVAVAAPFHLFLFAYAILGPLHYLTEISWLHNRQYFAPRAPLRRLWLFLVAGAAVAITYGFVSS